MTKLMTGTFVLMMTAAVILEILGLKRLSDYALSAGVLTGLGAGVLIVSSLGSKAQKRWVP